MSPHKWATFEEAVIRLGLSDPLDGTPITPEKLLEVLKDDVVHVLERPGSWEGSNMEQVLICHGFMRH